MSDIEIRRLERLAKQGDPDAIKKLERLKQRNLQPIWTTSPFEQLYNLVKTTLVNLERVEDPANTVWFWGLQRPYTRHDQIRDLDRLAEYVQDRSNLSVSDMLLVKRGPKAQFIFLFGITHNTISPPRVLEFGPIPTVVGHILRTKYTMPLYIADDIHPYPKFWSTNVWEIDE